MSQYLRRLFVLTLIAAVVALGVTALAAPRAERVKLKNGLTLIVLEDHASPVASLQVWVRAGARLERPLENGITHFIEHMIFKGTPTRPTGAVSRQIESAGGSINAGTSYDYTYYYVTMASRYFNTAIDVLADAIQNSVFDPVEIRRERKVVLEEWRMNQDKPSSRLWRALFKTAFTTHNYRRAILGEPKHIKSFSRKMIKDYMKRWYVPGNMVIVAVGDFDKKKVIAKLTKAFSHLPVLPVPKVTLSHEPPQKGIRIKILRAKVSVARVALGWHIPVGLGHPDEEPLDILAMVLGSGRTSRLYRELRDKTQLVHSVSAFAFTPRDPGLFGVFLTLAPKNIKAALAKTLQSVYAARNRPASDEELKRIKLNITSDFIFNRQTVQGQARTLGSAETNGGGIERLDRYVTRVEAVTDTDLLRVARRYLTTRNLTVIVMVPQQAKLGLTAKDIAQISKRAEVAAGPKKAAAKKAPRIFKYKLKNGLTLLIKVNKNVPVWSARLVMLGGLRFETKKTNGINALLSPMLTRGTKNYTARQLAKRVESMAGSVGGFAGKNSFGLHATFLSRFFEPGMKLLAEVATAPTFPESELKKVKRDIVAAILRRKDSLTSTAVRLFNKKMFLPHPYGLDPLGTPGVVMKMTGQTLAAWWKKYAVPDNMVLAVVGDVDPAKTLALVKKLFGHFKPGFKMPRIAAEPRFKKSIVASVVRQGKRQVHILYGFRGLRLDSPDVFALDILTSVLNGMGGRLFINLRDKRSLAYSVVCIQSQGLSRGYVAVYIGTAAAKMSRAIAGLYRELAKLIKQPITVVELGDAKRHIIGTMEVGLQRNSAQALEMALYQRYGLGWDYKRKYAERINKVTRADVLRVAKKYLRFKRSLLVTVGPVKPK
ncbi:MAG: insulinase family protein [Proteobacteria bacterium]|nr:insulinase family protein [Pseudomonadota bacterium]